MAPDPARCHEVLIVDGVSRYQSDRLGANAMSIDIAIGAAAGAESDVQLAGIEYEIEPARETAVSVRDSHQQFAAEQAVTRVRRFVGKIELRGQ